MVTHLSPLSTQPCPLHTPLFSKPHLHHSNIYSFIVVFTSCLQTSAQTLSPPKQGPKATVLCLVLVIWSISSIYGSTNKASYLQLRWYPDAEPALPWINLHLFIDK